MWKSRYKKRKLVLLVTFIKLATAIKAQKDIKVYVTKVTDGSLGEFWDLKLGDVNVVETVKM